MYIMDQSKKVIHNTDFIQRFHIVAKSDAWLVISSIEHDKTPDTLGRYFTEAEAKSVLEQLFKALINEDHTNVKEMHELKEKVAVDERF